MKGFILGFLSGIYVSTLTDVKPYVQIAEKETIKQIHLINEYVKKRYEHLDDPNDKKEFMEKYSR